METQLVTRNLLLLLFFASAPGAVYVHGWYGLGVSLCWGCVGALVCVYGLMKGLKLRNPKMKYGGLDVSLPKYVLFFSVTGLATLVVEMWLATLELDDDISKRVPLMTGANLVVFLVATVLGLSIKVDNA